MWRRHWGGGKLGTYKTGDSSTITVDRYKDGYDGLYNKYYLLSEGKIVKGPVYATDIVAKNGDSAPAKQSGNLSKKGLFGEPEGITAYKDSGAGHTAINISVSKLIYPNEIVADGVRVPLSHPDDALEFVSGGVKYYFNVDELQNYEKVISDYAQAGAQITAIIVALPESNEEIFPQSLTYAPYSTQGTTLMSLNTSNELGFRYFVALMELLAERHTDNDGARGFISNFVIGNEIDYARDYNRISDKQAHVDVYMEEYSRLLRLANLAVKKYNSSVTVSMPITQSWAEKGYGMVGDLVGAYVPKTLVEWLNTKTKSEGDYDWAIAPHVYGYHLAQAAVFYLDTLKSSGIGINGGRNAGITNDYNTTAKITFSNLELLDDYLNQDFIKCDGQVRKVYLTEAGVSSYWGDDNYGTEGLSIQAATIAACYYKISQLNSVVSFCYYRGFDNAIEADDHSVFGLYTIDYKEKPAFEVYKYIDTQYSSVVANKYLKYLSYHDYDTLALKQYGKDFDSYTQLLNIFNTSHDFGEFDWQAATPVTAPTVYEYEDKIALGNVKFADKTYLYDGKEHTVTVSGTLPDGVTVTYDDNKLTEVGTKQVLATFTKDGDVVARRSATLEVTKIYTDKKVYARGEKIFVTPYIDEGLSRDAWIGIYKEGSDIEKDPSKYWCNFNLLGDGLSRTFCMQEQQDNLQGGIMAGVYTIVYFADGGYNKLYETQITVKSYSDVDDDVSGVTLPDQSFVYDGTEHVATVSGTLPEGVSVVYTGNEQTEVGAYQMKAELVKDGEVIAVRYAVFTVEPQGIDRLVTDKTTYEVGEDILVTATATPSSASKEWWVGLYVDTDDIASGVYSVYWYYVKDETHLSGTAYNIREQSHNPDRKEYVTIPAGNYKLVLFDGNSEIVKTVEIAAVKSTVTEKGTLTTDKTTYSRGESIMVTATCPDKIGNKVYWVGIYKKGETPDEIYSIYWYYVKDDAHTSGTAYDIRLQAPNNSRPDFAEVGSLPAGEYTLMLFNSEGYDVETSVDITVTSDGEDPEPSLPEVTLDKTQYAVGEAVNVTVTIPDGIATAGWWIGVYGADEQPSSTVRSYLWYYIVDGNHENGKTYNILNEDRTSGRIDKAELPAGSYKVVLFDQVGQTVLSVKFDVIEQKTAKITTDKTEYTFGEDVLVTARCPDEKTDWWVGLYLKDDDVNNVASVYWYNVVDGSHVSGTAYNIKAQTANSRNDLLNLPAGEYKVVLFNSGGYTVEEAAYFTIVSSDATKPTITTDKTTFAVGESIVFEATRPQDGGYYWWGLYSADVTPGEQGVESIAWGEVNESSSSVDLSAKLSESLAAGNYKLVLFVTSGFSAVAQADITIVAAGE